VVRFLVNLLDDAEESHQVVRGVIVNAGAINCDCTGLVVMVLALHWLAIYPDASPAIRSGIQVHVLVHMTKGIWLVIWGIWQAIALADKANGIHLVFLMCLTIRSRKSLVHGFSNFLSTGMNREAST
jgi:hypothetical protein